MTVLLDILYNGQNNENDKEDLRWDQALNIVV